jgi:prepilin-type N-terminal cleavage/methylation domain-containing protein/prepilin-type processing-associated H-X9-DG protein
MTISRHIRINPKRHGFTLIELLVVIAIIGLLLSIMMPALNRAKELARGIICRTHLKTLSLSNKIYASENEGWYVASIDATMTTIGEPTWNSNSSFRDIVGLTGKDTGSDYKMPKDYLCPSDKQSTEQYWSSASSPYKNYVSYGYNFTDWGPNSANPARWSGNIPKSDWACRLKENGQVAMPSQKVMFLDAGDIWVERDQADYTKYWDEYGQDISAYRSVNAWRPTYYRHNEGVDVTFFDGHVEYISKKKFFHYDDNYFPDDHRNNKIWFCDPSNIK